MDLSEALRTTSAVREFRPDPVPDEVVYQVLDTARFCPSGGNRQAWHVVLVKDPELRRRLRDLYLPGWYDYLAQRAAGLTPWSPVNDRDAEAEAMKSAPALARQAAEGPGGFAEHLDEVPVLLVLLADLSGLATVDRDLPRYTMAGGASVYPFAWSILLAAHEHGLGGVMTTMLVRREQEVKELLGAPEAWAVAAVLALGVPQRRLRKLTRRPVESLATLDRFGGEPLRG